MGGRSDPDDEGGPISVVGVRECRLSTWLRPRFLDSSIVGNERGHGNGSGIINTALVSIIRDPSRTHPSETSPLARQICSKKSVDDG